MSPTIVDLRHTLELLARCHGHGAWLAVAALAHPTVLLYRGRRHCHGAVVAALTLVTGTFAGGLALYNDYRLRVRHGLFEAAPTLGWLFERKEHMAVAVVAFAWVGAAAYAASHSHEDANSSALLNLQARSQASSRAVSQASSQASSQARGHLRRAAAHAFALAFLGALTAAASGSYIASFRSFASSPPPPTAPSEGP